jgi:hypothetical protein
MMLAPQAARPSRQARRRRRSYAACAAKNKARQVSSRKHHGSASRLCSPEQRIFGITEIEGGFPHSEIRGSKVVRTSPRLIAAYHVLHRLSAPRHPPNTLKALDRSHYQRPPLGRGHMICIMCGRDRKTICFKHIREHRGQAMLTTGSSSSRASMKSEHPHECRSPNFRSINDRICFLFTMTDSTAEGARRATANSVYPRILRAQRRQSDRLVEPDGIEPTTSCLQSTRSPN